MDPAGQVSVAPQPEKELLRWSAMSRPFKPLDRQIFATGVVIAVLISVIAAFAGEWMLIAVIIAMVFAYYVWSTVAPEQTEYQVTTKGIRLHNQIYLWQEMSRWWFDDKWGHRMLVLDTPLTFPKQQHLILGTASEEQLKSVLEKYLVYEKPADTTLDKAGRWMAEKFPLQAR